MKPSHTVFAILFIASTAAKAQVVPAVTGPTGLPVSGTLNYGLRYSQTSQFGGDQDGQLWGFASGDASYTNISQRLPFRMQFGGGFGWDWAHTSSARDFFEHLSLSQAIVGRAWSLTAGDNVSYSYQTPTTGFSGIPGTGEPIGGSGSTSVPDQTILALNTRMLDNFATIGLQDRLNYAWSLDIGGSSLQLRFLDNSAGYMLGAKIDNVNANYSRDFGKSLSIGVTGSYMRSSSLFAYQLAIGQDGQITVIPANFNGECKVWRCAGHQATRQVYECIRKLYGNRPVVQGVGLCSGIVNLTMLEDYATGILKRRFWLILTSAVASSGLASASATYLPPQYVSQTLVLIEQQKVPEDYVKPVVDEDLGARLASMKEQILSRSRIEPIIERFNLYAGKNTTMDDRIDMTQKAIGIKPIRSSAVAWNAGLLYHVQGAGRAHGPAGMRRDHVAVCQRESECARGVRRRHHRLSEAATGRSKRNLDDQDAKLAAFEQKNIGKLPGADDHLGDMSRPWEAQTKARFRR
jgi:hypothetical protein